MVRPLLELLWPSRVSLGLALISTVRVLGRILDLGLVLATSVVQPATSSLAILNVFKFFTQLDGPKLFVEISSDVVLADLR